VIRIQDVLAAVDLDGPAVDGVEVRRQIAGVLDDPRYSDLREPLLERLLGPVYDWIEKMLAFVAEMIRRAIEFLAGFLEIETLSWLGPLLVVIAAAVGGFFLARRRARDIERQATIERILELGTDPSELERRADEADATGDHSEAIRLRFVAGLLRLDQAGRIDFYPGLPNSTISELVGSAEFDRLASQFDAVVYGRRAAKAPDSRQSSSDWSALLGVRA
jgi:hypothetical protein